LATVNNIVAAILSSPTSTVTKSATASLTGMGGGTPNLPLVIGDCDFNQNCYDASCLPTLTQAPNTTNDSAWTAFSSANTSNVSDYFPTACQHGARGTPFPSVTVGDQVSLINGQSSSLLDLVACLFTPDGGGNQFGVTQFTVPIVSCGNQFNGSH